MRYGSKVISETIIHYFYKRRQHMKEPRYELRLRFFLVHACLYAQVTQQGKILKNLCLKIRVSRSLQLMENCFIHSQTSMTFFSFIFFSTPFPFSLQFINLRMHTFKRYFFSSNFTQISGVSLALLELRVL